MTTTMTLPQIKQDLLALQKRICSVLEKEDGGTFIEQAWDHHQGGGGVSCALTNGAVIEKAAVNFSHVSGNALPHAATQKRPQLAEASFQALGVSVIVHPRNPFAPTTHMNVRFIQTEKNGQLSAWWFGGGFDLTPYYGFAEDCIHWHTQAQAACLPFGRDVYPKYKSWCDEYFFLKHRNEPRGIGGIFFDDLHEWGFEACFAFMRQTGNAFIDAYQPILAKRKHLPFTQKQREFQLFRRGRYVEFNLLYDRGTLFGLQSGGRTESILMSLPPAVSWPVAWQAEENSPESRLYEEFLKPREWV